MRIIESQNPRPLNLLAVSAQGLVAAASSTFGAPGHVEVWDAASGSQIHRHAEKRKQDTIAGALAFMPHRPLLLLGDRFFVTIIDPVAKTAEHTPPLILGSPHFALSRDGTRLLVTESMTGRWMIECFMLEADPRRRNRVWSQESLDHVVYDCPAIPPGGPVAISERDQSRSHPRHAIQLRDADSGTIQRRIELDPASPVKQLLFTADGAKLLVRTDSRIVQMFDAATGAPAGELVHTGRPFVTGIAVHPCGPVACARANGTVTLWDAEKREQIRTLDWKAGRLASVAFSPDGALGAAGTEDGKIIAWDVDL